MRNRLKWMMLEKITDSIGMAAWIVASVFFNNNAFLYCTLGLLYVFYLFWIWNK